MTRAILPLLLLSATAFAQGTYRPPPPPRPSSYSPTVAVPVTPGHGVAPATPAPRGTDSRVLPPTKEAGIWAVNKPRAPETLPEPKLLDVDLPYPPNAMSDVEKNPARFCAKAMNDALARLVAAGTRPPLPAPQGRPCAAALMYQKCIIEGAKAAKAAKESGAAFDDAVFDAFIATLQKTNAWHKAMCPDDRDNTDAAGFAHAVITEWIRHEHGQRAKH